MLFQKTFKVFSASAVTNCDTEVSQTPNVHNEESFQNIRIVKAIRHNDVVANVGDNKSMMNDCREIFQVWDNFGTNRTSKRTLTSLEWRANKDVGKNNAW